MKLAWTFGAWLALLSARALGQDSGATLESLARDLQRVESVREIKDVGRAFSQLSQFGRWADMAALFSDNATLRYGNATAEFTVATGHAAIQHWLEVDAAGMDGIAAGSLNNLLAENPVVSLAADDLTAKARWEVLRLNGDGKGGTRIEGGIFENEYALDTRSGQWKMSLLHYYTMYNGTYADGWTNIDNRTLPIVPYHYTPDSVGIPVLLSASASCAPSTNMTISEVAARVDRLNAEDEVRNLQNTYGYYVDRRWWSNAVDLFASDASIFINETRYTGSIRQYLEQMGPENLTEGILNDHPLFSTIIDVSSTGCEAISRGIEIGMIGDSNTKSATWIFAVFRNQFVKDVNSGMWKIQQLNESRIVVANYSSGWGKGGLYPHQAHEAPPPFLETSGRSHRSACSDSCPSGDTGNAAQLSELQRRLSRSAAYDGAENPSSAYGQYATDLRCQAFADLHHSNGTKQASYIGWYQGPTRIANACLANYQSYEPDPQRANIAFHWRMQPVVIVSQDGRSLSYRTRLLEWGTSNATIGGFSGVYGFNAGQYNDQMALETTKNGTLRWKIWNLNIDEAMFQSSSWPGGWVAYDTPRSQSEPPPAPNVVLSKYPPDLAMSDPRLGPREVGQRGGAPPYAAWPDIHNMWFAIRNPVSGRVPATYWPGCTPCKVRPDWSLLANGYEEPPTGPTVVSAVASNGGHNVTVSIVAGPDEPLGGNVEFRDGAVVVAQASIGSAGSATVAVPPAAPSAYRVLTVVFLGSERLSPGQTRVVVT